MSLSLKKIDVINVKDPRVIVNQKQDYVYLEGASQISQKNYVTTSVSNSSLQFSCPPPSMSTFVDRKIRFQGPVRLTFTATSTAAGESIIVPGHDAPRAYGLSSATDVVNCTINNFQISNNISDYVQPLLRYNVGDRLKYSQYSTTPTYPDQSQLYSSLVGSIRNPLGSYGDGIDQQTPRGGFNKYKVVSQTVIVGGVSQNQPSTASGQAMTSIVDIVFTEPFFMLAPIAWQESEVHPFVNISTMDFNITLLNQAANRMWSRDETSLALTSLNFTWASLIPSGGPAFSFPETQPNLQFNYFTPKETQIIPRDMIACYPYFDIQRFPTDISGVTSNPTVFTSNNVQLSTIPNRMYIFVRQQNSTLYSSCTNTDTFAAIDKISIQYYNRTGILSSASRNQLYQISVKNGCNMSWEQWSGDAVYTNGTYASQYNTVGSVIALSPAEDLGLDSLQAPGKIDHNTFQIDVTIRNLNPSITNYTIYIVVINEGVFSIAPGLTSGQIGVLSSQDILDARSKPYINYENIKDVYGGDFLSGLKSFFTETIPSVLRKSKIASNLANLLPVVGPAVSKSIRNLGYGEEYDGYGDDEGGVLVDDRGGVIVGGVPVGGRELPRRKLRASMKKRIM